MNNTDPPSVRRLLIYSSRNEDGRMIETMVSSKGTTILRTDKLSEAKELIGRQQCDCVVSHVIGHDCEGMELLNWVNESIFDISCFGVVDTCNTELYNRVFRLGADGCFYFHSLNVDRLTIAIERVFKDSDNPWIERRSAAFNFCSQRIIAESKSNSNLLLIGPHGVGKSAIARVIHDQSDRSDKPFVVAECAHYAPEECLEIFVGSDSKSRNSILRNQQGLLAQAKGGTLYVHEVCQLPLQLQEILATAIQRRVYRPRMMNKEIPFTGRIILSTREDLGKMVHKGDFSKTLYDCICANSLVVPTLADCQEDIIPLAEAFIKQICTSLGLPIPRLTAGATKKLHNHIWMGNVRELFSTISQACNTFSGTTIGKDEIVLQELHHEGPVHSRKYKLRKALQQTKGNKAQAAKILGINRTTIYTWLEEEGLPVDYR